MSHKTANNALMHPFSVLRRIGFSSRVMQRLERYRSQQDRQGRVVSVLSWADGTWCALSLHCEKTGAVVVDEGQEVDAYEAPAPAQRRFCPFSPCAGSPA